MATPFSIGHAMRRRNGTPASSLEAVGNMKERNHVTHHEAVDAAAQVGSPRLPISAAPAPQGTLVPRKNTQAGDPTNPGSKANRQNIERVGAQYHISVPFTPTIDPAAGPTMANAKIVPSVAGRNANFGAGEQSSMA